MPYRSERAALEATAKGWRALAILAALDKVEPAVVRSRILVWLIRAPEPDALNDLIARAQDAAVEAGWLTADANEPEVPL